MAGGVVSSSYFTGNLVGTLLTGLSLNALALTAAIIWPPSFLPWLCRPWPDDWILELVGVAFCAGIGCAMIWVVVESALMCSGRRVTAGGCLLRI